MKTLYLLLLRSFIPNFLMSLGFLVLIIELVDLFANLWQYLGNDATFAQIMAISFYYIPKSISFALPVSLMFAVCFTQGTFYAQNELIAVFSAGIPLYRFIVPFAAVGVILSIAGFFFEDNIVIESQRKKTDLSRELLGLAVSLNNNNVTVTNEGQRVILRASFYNDDEQVITGVIFLEKDEEHMFTRRVDAEWGEWKNDEWTLHNCRIYKWNEEKTYITDEVLPVFSDPVLNIDPETLQRSDKAIDQMRLSEASEWIDQAGASGLPVRELEADYFTRYSFSLTPIIIVLISAAIGGSFKKNILLMSLLASISISVPYFVLQLVTTTMAKNYIIPPLVSAWIPFFVFMIIAILMIRLAKT